MPVSVRLWATRGDSWAVNNNAAVSAGECNCSHLTGCRAMKPELWVRKAVEL
jgi:hypothetical protein